MKHRWVNVTDNRSVLSVPMGIALNDKSLFVWVPQRSRCVFHLKIHRYGVIK